MYLPCLCLLLNQSETNAQLVQWFVNCVKPSGLLKLSHCINYMKPIHINRLPTELG